MERPGENNERLPTFLTGLRCHTDGAACQANTSGIMFDIEESVPLWDNSTTGSILLFRLSFGC